MKMKYANQALAVCFLINFSLSAECNSKEISDQFTIKIEARWEDLEKNKKKKNFEDKWILVGDITIKKTAADYISLQELQLNWNGKKINQLTASLYEKNSDKNFMPIERYLLCDSIWKKSEQKLILKFKEPKTLCAINKLSLVLTIPKDMEEILKSGGFTLDTEYLPQPYKEFAQGKDLSLNLCDANL